jgi:hypothetical protein
MADHRRGGGVIDRKELAGAAFVALLGLVALAGSFLAGRWSAPRLVSEQIVTDERETFHAFHAQHSTSFARQSKHHTLVWNWKTWPDGRSEVEAREDTREASETGTDVSTVDKESKESGRHAEKLKLVQTERPGWAVAARAGLRLDLSKVAGLAVERRLLGGVWAGAWADTSKAAGLQLRVEF